MDPKTQELERRYEKMRRARAHDVFELWEGCGRDLVNERFYELVKEYHPDNYAGDSMRARELAQEIFLLVRSARTKLLKVEREQTRESPGSDRQDAMERLKRRAGGLNMDGLDALSQASEAYEAMSSAQQETLASSRSLEPPRVEVNRSSEISRPGETGAQLSAPSSSPRGLSESSMSSAERRQALEALASKRSRRPLRRAQITRPSVGEESSMSAEDRAAKLAALASKRPKAPFELSQASAVSLAAESSSSLAGTSSPSVLPTAGYRPDDVTSTNTMSKLTPKEAFRRGYQDFKLERYDSALNALAFAHDGEPENGLFMTYYAYALFKADANANKAEAEKLLRAAIKTGDRQALPDAHLFLGLVLISNPNKTREAQKHFRATLQLNPSSHEAQRQIRLYEMRKRNKAEAAEEQSDGGSLFKKLFKK
jgi:tetratricopeptide (TPR) repeat protein